MAGSGDKNFSPKVNVIARLEFELAYFMAAVHHFSYYVTVTPKLIGILDIIYF